MRAHRSVVRRALLVFMLAGLAATGHAQVSEELCGSLTTHYGPFDYRTDRQKLGIVEKFHFTPKIEALLGGETGTIEGELDYVLRAFPNHHRALAAVVRLSQRPFAAGRQPVPTDCYFERALRFRPDDHVVRMLFASHLGRTGRGNDAATQLDYVRSRAGDNALTHYNLGLQYLKIGRTDEALAMARRAAELGMQRTELRDQLRARGKWVEPEAAPASLPAPALPAGSASRNGV
jgi:tetratricopeptide (TPR) repeat protein